MPDKIPEEIKEYLVKMQRAIADELKSTFDTFASINDYTTFIELSDTPGSFIGSGSTTLKVNADTTAIEFGA